MFGVLRKHRSEVFGRRLCLVFIYMQKPGIDVFRKPQSNTFIRLHTIFKKSLLQEGGMFGVLRKHRSEDCGRRLCLVLVLYQFIGKYHGQYQTDQQLEFVQYFYNHTGLPYILCIYNHR